MKRLVLFCLIICLICPFGGTAAAIDTMQPETGNGTLSCNTLDASVGVLGNGKRIENASSAILYEVNSDTLMYHWNADLPSDPASFSKILTALIAIEQGNLTDQVRIRGEDIKDVPYNAVSAQLQDGEVLTLEQLLYCMMVGSANDAASAIAAHISGSQAEFAKVMNTYAQSLGCTASYFANAHGLYHQDQHTTARDIARILSAAVKNDFFMELFGTTYYVLPETNLSPEREFYTSNYMLLAQEDMYYDARVTGGRTGVADNGARCLAVTAEENGMQLISIVMGSKSTYAEDGYTVERYGGFAETSSLLDEALDGYRCVQVLFQGQILRQCNVIGGSNSLLLGSTSSLWAVLPGGVTSDNLQYHYLDNTEQFRVPIEKGAVVSGVEIWYGGMRVAYTQLQAMNGVYAPEPQSDAQDSETDRSWIWQILLICAICALGFLLLLALIRSVLNRIKRSATAKRSRRRRKNRRRSR